jgi:hypothetical protein
MPIDPSIALQYRSFEAPNPLAQYAQVMQLQGVQNSNALAQYQLSKAKREDEIENAMADVYRRPGIVDPATGAINRKELVAAASQGPAAGRIPALLKSLDSMDAERLKTLKASLEIGGGAYASIAQNPTRQNAEQQLARLAQLNVPGVDRMLSSLPQTPEEIRQWAMTHGGSTEQTLKVLKAYQPEVEKVDTGSAVEFRNKNPLGGVLGAPMGAPIAKTATPGDMLSAETTRRGQNMTDTRSKEANTIAQGGRAREDADNLRKEFNAHPAVKNFSDIAPIYNAALKAPDTPAGDFALIYGVGKILDPGSVVREGEMGMVIKSGSPAERVNGFLQYLQGNGRLTPQMRKELNAMLGNAVGERETVYKQARSTYEGLATERGYDPAKIFVGSPEVGSAAPAAPAAAPASKRIELDSLPDPAQFNGKQMTDKATGTKYRSDGSRWVRVQ